MVADDSWKRSRIGKEQPQEGLAAEVEETSKTGKCHQREGGGRVRSLDLREGDDERNQRGSVVHQVDRRFSAEAVEVKRDMEAVAQKQWRRRRQRR